MKDHRTPLSYRQHVPAHKSSQASAAKGVRELLQHHNGIAALLPAAERLAALRRDCAAALPAMFDACSLLQFMSGQLTLSAPNAALAAKLKQHVPRLQDFLVARGWQVSAIRIKVQVIRQVPTAAAPLKRLAMPASAIAAFSELESGLSDGRQETALQSAVRRMLERHRKG